MEYDEKIREHIVIPEAVKMTFEEMKPLLDDVIKNVLEDEPIAFSFINEQGLIVGSEGLFPVQNYVFNDGTLLRVFTMRTRWRISVIRRHSRYVTFIELLSPKDTAEKMPEVLQYILEKTNGCHAELKE